MTIILPDEDISEHVDMLHGYCADHDESSNVCATGERRIHGATLFAEHWRGTDETALYLWHRPVTEHRCTNRSDYLAAADQLVATAQEIAAAMRALADQVTPTR